MTDRATPSLVLSLEALDRLELSGAPPEQRANGREAS
jgi:hypothetical protein